LRNTGSTRGPRGLIKRHRLVGGGRQLVEDHPLCGAERHAER
jgi:hypothetical protein